MKTYIVNVQVEFTCVDPEMARERVMDIKYGSIQQFLDQVK